jgi:hypothetical protein
LVNSVAEAVALEITGQVWGHLAAVQAQQVVAQAVLQLQTLVVAAEAQQVTPAETNQAALAAQVTVE